MSTARAIVLRAAGTNCDHETVRAFELAGAEAERVHVMRLREGKTKLGDYDILAIPGGFSYGDDIASGRILAGELNAYLAAELSDFVASGRLVIGICNGFQVLVKAGLLPGPPSPTAEEDTQLNSRATLTWNLSGRFEARWIKLMAPDSIDSPWVRPGFRYELPIAHAEGRFVTASEADRQTLQTQIALQYATSKNGDKPIEYPENPNGSIDDIAGIVDRSGRIFGLMPHPERHVSRTHHPEWTRRTGGEDPDGLIMFKDAVASVKG